MRHTLDIRWHLPSIGLCAALAAALATSPVAAQQSIPLSAARILIELNDTARDAGIQMFFDGEGWKQMQVFNPSGEKVLDVKPDGAIAMIGMTELFFESAEPSLDDLPLADLLKLFPAGKYRIAGISADGARMFGTAVLSHDIPAGPHVVKPAAGSLTDISNTVIDWNPVPDPIGGRIKGYQVIVELPVPLRVFSVDLPAEKTAVKVPTAFLQRGTDYKFEVLAVTESGNQTITESTFRTAR